MKTKINVLAIVILSTLSIQSAKAMVACISPVCEDGSQCTAGGTTSATCGCALTPLPGGGYGPNHASCSSGLVVSTNGSFPQDFNVNNFTIMPILDSTAYSVTPKAPQNSSQLR